MLHFSLQPLFETCFVPISMLGVTLRNASTSSCTMPAIIIRYQIYRAFLYFLLDVDLPHSSSVTNAFLNGFHSFAIDSVSFLVISSFILLRDYHLTYEFYSLNITVFHCVLATAFVILIFLKFPYTSLCLQSKLTLRITL